MFLPYDTKVCEHCEELWSSRDANGFYTLDPAKMEKAAEVYKPGKTGVMRKWQEIAGASAVFEEEVGLAKDIFCLTHEVPSFICRKKNYRTTPVLTDTKACCAQ